MTTVQILLITLIAYWKMTDTVTLQLFAFNGNYICLFDYLFISS